MLLHKFAGIILYSKVVLGGETQPEALRIAPTVMDGVTWDDAVMGQEIFGPILPVLTFDQFGDIPAILRDKHKPLALYLFSEDKTHIHRALEDLRYGGGCANDTVIHLAGSNMGFGSVGESGIGSYHGKAGFEAFPHRKNIVDKKTWIDLPTRYQLYRPIYENLLWLFLK